MTNSKEFEGSRPQNNIERAVVLQTHTDIPAKLDRERVIVVPRNLEDDIAKRKLRELGDYRMRANPVGELFIDRFRSTGIQVGLSDVPPSIDLGFDSREVVEKLWPRIPNVETGIRYTNHIADEYDKRNGQETLSIRTIHDAMRQVSLELQKPVGERIPWDELEQMVAAAIVKSGFDNARDTNKLGIKDAMLAAVKKDRLDRPNSARTRLMLAHLIPDLTKMRLRNQPKYNKYRYLESVLYKERARDRMPFEEFIRSVRELSAMDSKNHNRPILKNKIRHDAYQQMKPLRIKTAPYVQLGAVARFLMFGKKTEEQQKLLAGYIGEDLARETVSVPVYSEFTTEEDQINRLIRVADYLEASLEEADGQLPELQRAA